MQKKSMIKLIVILLLCFTLLYYVISVFYYASGRNREYQPDWETIQNSIYIDAKQRLFIGPHNSIIIIDGIETHTFWEYRGGFWIAQLEPQYDENEKISSCFYVGRPIRGDFRYTKNDRLILKSSLFYSQIFRGKRFVLQRYDMDAIDWDALPLSEEAVSWLVDGIEVEIKPQQ